MKLLNNILVNNDMNGGKQEKASFKDILLCQENGQTGTSALRLNSKQAEI